MINEIDFFREVVRHWIMMDWDCEGSKTFIAFMDGDNSFSYYGEGERGSDLYFTQRGSVKELIDCFDEMIWFSEINDWRNKR